jgi:hypothetical protein
VATAEAKTAQRRKQESRAGKQAGGYTPQAPDPEQAQPEAKAQRNFTDPGSRIAVNGANQGSSLQAHTARAAVDSEAQVIVAAGVTRKATESCQLVPMIEQVSGLAHASRERRGAEGIRAERVEEVIVDLRSLRRTRGDADGTDDQWRKPRLELIRHGEAGAAAGYRAAGD